MLKNKKSIYILIPLNIFIWGFFVYRFYSAFTESDIPTAVSDERAISQKTLVEDSIVYKLDLSYKDPFLKEEKRQRRIVTHNQSGASSVPAEAKQMPIAKTPTVVIKQSPDLKYLGLIKNKNSGMSTALVSVNGQSRLIKPSEVVEGITFKSFNNDSLVARWGKEKIVVRR